MSEFGGRGSWKHEGLSRGSSAFVLVVVGWMAALAACSRGEAPLPAPAGERVTLALNAAPQTPHFVVQAQHSVKLGTGGLVVNGGDIGASGTSGPFLSGNVAIDTLSGVQVQTTRNLIAPSVRLGTGVVVGDVQTNSFTPGTGGSRGTVTPFVPLPPLPVAAAVTPGTGNLTVATGATVTASAFNFAAVSVGTGSTLRLPAGIYQMASLSLASSGRMEALGPIQVRVAGRLAGTSGVFIGPAAGTGLTAKDIRIEVSGINGTSGAITATPKVAAFSSGGSLRALMLVPNGTLQLATGMTASGAFMARNVDVGGSGTQIVFQDGFPPACTAASCNDNNPCTTDTCGAGGCTHANLAAGTSCGDGNACNGAEVCNGAGSCQPGTPVVCTAQDQCHAAGTCNPATGVCSNPNAADGTSCNDSNACTQTDTCQSGTCTGSNQVSCAAQDQCHVAGTCNPATGTCSNPAADDGTSCNDSNACTQTDTCQSGSCLGGSPVTCVAQGQCHSAGTCDPGTGACSNPPQVDGFACDDGNACTASDMCVSGTCVAGPASCNGPFALGGTVTFTNGNYNVSSAVSADRSDAAPGDQIGVTATFTNNGLNFSTFGRLEAENTGDAAVVLGSIEARLEYFSGAGNEWVALSTAGRNESGAALPAIPPSSFINLSPALFDPGVTYFPLFSVPGTTIQPGSTAGWTYFAGTLISSPEGLAAVAAARTSPVRFVLRVGTSPASTTADRVIDVTSTFANLPAIPLASGNVTASLDAGSPVSLSPSGTITAEQTTATYSGTVVRPVVPSRSTFTSDGAYLQVLAVEVARTPSIVVTSPSTAVALTLTGVVPLLRSGVVNPPSIGAGQPVHYGLQFRNDGTGLASAVSVTHVLNGSPLGTVTAPPELAAGASATGGVDFTAPGNPPLADQVVVTWNDRNGNLYGPISHTPASCPAETCASLNLAQTTGSGPAVPRLQMTFEPTPASAAPGDPVTFNAQVAHVGAGLPTTGSSVGVTNAGFAPFIVEGYRHTLEYYSLDEQQWVPFAGRVVDNTGTVVPDPTLLPLDWFSEPDFSLTGVGYTFQIVGTTIDPGALARWTLTYPTEAPAAVVIPPNILAILLDPSESGGVRSKFRFDVSAGAPPEPAVVDLTSAFSGFTSDVNILSTDVYLTATHNPNFAASGLMPLTPASTGPLSPGGTRAFSGTFPVPPVNAQEATEYWTLDFIRQRGFLFRGQTIASAGSSQMLTTATALLGAQLPVISPQKTGPAQSNAGLTQNYTVALQNIGNITAESVAVTDTENGVPIPGAVISAPTTVNAGQISQATITVPTPLERPAGPMTDVAGITWRDRNGNQYGPAQSSFTTEMGPAHPEGYLSVKTETGIPDVIGISKLFVVTALNPNGSPVQGVTVHFAVTGVNPQSADVVTGADGRATFSYSGTTMGDDAVVASAMITTIPITLDPIQVQWATSVGTPCTGRATPLDIMVVLDISGSMAYELPSSLLAGKLEAARDATHRFIDNLDPARDQIGVTTFYGLVTSFAGLSTDTSTAKQQITAGVDKGFECIGGIGCFEAFFGDGLAGALNVAIDELESPRHRPEATKVLVYVGDGGTYADPTAAIARLHSSGIRAVAIGVGVDSAPPDVTSGEVVRSVASTPNDYFYTSAAGDMDWVYNHLNQDICRNRQPLVSAGGDQGAYNVRLPQLLTLNGEVHDDGATGDSRLTSEWTVVSGPGTVTFVDANSPVTQALFTEPGNYVLQLAATDGYLTVADRATISVDPDPSLAGASLVVQLGASGPLTTGTTENVTATLTDNLGAPLNSFAVRLTVAGANPLSTTLLTNSAGVVVFQYRGIKPGSDVIHATALGTTATLESNFVALDWIQPNSGGPIVPQGWIAEPQQQAQLTERVPIVLASNVTLASGSLTYWPVSNPAEVHAIAASVSGGPGSTLGTLDTTLLANGNYVIDLTGTNDAGVEQTSEIVVTVTGEYKPGRMVVETRELTIPIAGLPIVVGRRYDSLEKDKIGDFGYGWSLTIGHPRLEVDPITYGVSVTLSDGRRSTFRLGLEPYVNEVSGAFLGVYRPIYQSEPGVFGTLTGDGCPVVRYNPGSTVSPIRCFLFTFTNEFEPQFNYAPEIFVYTDPYGREFTMGATGELKSIKDHLGNTLTFAPNGILSSAGPAVNFERDAQGRITRVIAQVGDLQGPYEVGYTYDGAGDLDSVTTPPLFGQPVVTHYAYASHRLTSTMDPRANPARTSTYTPEGRLATDTDALEHVISYSYNLGTRTTVTTFPDTGQFTEVFDTRGLVLSETDPLGRTRTHEYDGNRNETKLTNALGEVTTAAYDTKGNQTSTTTAHGTMQTVYGAFSNPTSFTNELGHVTTIEYDDRKLPKRVADAIGTRAKYTYSEQGLLLTVEDAAGKSVSLTYDRAGNRTSITDRLGRVSRWTYDYLGRETTARTARGGLSTKGYTLDGLLTHDVDATGGVARFEYDVNRNRILNVTPDDKFETFLYNALNHVTRMREHNGGLIVDYTHDFRGNVLTAVDDAGRTTTYEYDLAGQLIKTNFPDNTFTTRTYDLLGRLESLTDERGHTTRYEYDEGCGCADRVTKVIDPLGRTTITTWDAAGRRTSVTDANNHTTSFAYDVSGRVTETNYPDGTTTRDEYDIRGRRLSTTDQLSKVTAYGYDDAGQMTSVTDPLGNVTAYTYDLDGNLASVKDGNNHTTTYEYDLMRRNTKRTLPLGMFETFTYTAGGFERTHVDFRGKTTTWAYDGRTRLLSKTPDPSLGEPAITFTYNPSGTRATMTDTSGTTSYTYDLRDRMLAKAAPAGTLTYTYDGAGNLATIRSSNANGTSVDYAWDTAGQLVSVTDNRAGGVTTAAYTATGRPDSVSQPNGVSQARSYDPLGRVTSTLWRRSSNPAFASWAYTHNLRGQRITATDVTGRQAAYGYDDNGRLMNETISGAAGSGTNGAITYTFDGVGNRLSRTSAITAVSSATYGYDANDQLTGDGYDLNGNTTSLGSSAFAYDFENRLVAKNGGAVTIVYDGDGARVAKTVGGITTKFLTDEVNPTGYLQVLEEVVGGAVQTRYTFGTSLVSQTRNVSTSPVTSYYGYDAHGNVTFLTDSSGAVTDAYDYDAWGNVVAQTGSTPNSRLYAGEEFDPDLGLVNLRARYYAPDRGRFLAIDPLRGDTRSPISSNKYLYASADPVNRIDPSGRVSAVEYSILPRILAAVLFLYIAEQVIENTKIKDKTWTEPRRYQPCPCCPSSNPDAKLNPGCGPPPREGEGNCTPVCLPYHSGGDALHNICADKLQTGLCTGDVRLNGKDFDARGWDDTMWEVKTGQFECNVPYHLDRLVAELEDDFRRATIECKKPFRVLVTEECLYKKLDDRLPGWVVHVPRSWCQ